MVDTSRLNAPTIIADYPYLGSCSHICDIGGGLGSFLFAVLSHYDFKMKGTNFDLPDVIENSKCGNDYHCMTGNNLTSQFLGIYVISLSLSSLLEIMLKV